MTETLSKDEVCRRLGIEGRTLERMIREGRFPRGIKPTPQASPIWSAEVVRAWLLVSPLMVADEAPRAEDAEKF